jgi:hypothetical protein
MPKSEAIGIINDSSEHASLVKKILRNFWADGVVEIELACFSGPHG